MKKGVAIPYIIAIILGVAVIGLVGYWLFFSGGQLGKGVATQQCRADFREACTEWANTGYVADSPTYKGVFQVGSDCESALVKDGNGDGALEKSDYRTACA